MSNYAALDTYLEPLKPFFDEDGVTEILINKAQEVWVENRGAFRVEKIPIFDFQHLKGMAKLVAQYTEQVVSEEKPLLSATLPNGYRVQFVIPPASEPKTLVVAIRKPSTLQLTLEDYEKMGLFDKCVTEKSVDEDYIKLKALLKEGKLKDFLREAVLAKKNIVISGGTSTGKTTFANAIIREIPKNERLITAEDAREMQLPEHPNHVHLIASKGGQGRANVTTQELIECCLRLRPDRIMVGELRGAEAFSFLRAINTGHPGSITTLHADTTDMAVEQLKLMVMQADLGLPPESVREYILKIVDIIVQLKRTDNGERYVSEVRMSER